MASMTIRQIDDVLKQRLRVRAAMHGRSMEDEARDILCAVLSSGAPDGQTLIESIRARIDPLGGVELELPTREAMRTVPGLDT
jgi:plasmid stability protein